MANKNSPPKVKISFDPESLRLEMDLKKGKFAELIGVSNNGYSGLANKPTQVRMETLAKIISATGVPIEKLFRVEPAE